MNQENFDKVLPEDRKLILGLLKQGRNVMNIAQEFGISPNTVENIKKGERHDKEGTRDEALVNEPRPE